MLKHPSAEATHTSLNRTPPLTIHTLRCKSKSTSIYSEYCPNHDMKQFLRTLKLIDDFSTTIRMERHAFYSRFKSSVDEGHTGAFSGTFDIFSRSKNEFKGHVALDSFKIKRKKTLFDMNTNLAVAQGTYRQDGESLIIEAEINGFTGMPVPFYVFVLIFYVIFMSSFIFFDDMSGVKAAFIFPFIILHATFMLGIPYLVMRRSVSRLKHELEREFYYMTKVPVM